MGPLDLGQFFSDFEQFSSFFAEKTFGGRDAGSNMCALDLLCGRPPRGVAFLKAGFTWLAMGWGVVVFCDAVLEFHSKVFLSSPKDNFCIVLKFLWPVK